MSERVVEALSLIKSPARSPGGLEVAEDLNHVTLNDPRKSVRRRFEGAAPADASHS